ncbi:MAG: hypothetical protein ACFE89_02050 [Candidatus Hodarchaeota archaeon]
MVAQKPTGDIEAAITGTTLRVYTYLYLHPENCAGPREIQRALGFKSPSSAIFQLEKLRTCGVVDKRRSGDYYLVHPVRIGILQYFVRIKGTLVPHTFFYALLVSVVIITLTGFLVRYGTLDILLPIVPSIIACLALWYETYLTWRRRPRIRLGETT